MDRARRVAAAPCDGTLSLPQLAHELNSLLDGVMRTVRLADRALEDASGVAEAKHRLRTAADAMSDMAAVLDRAMAGDPTQVGILRSARSLESEADLVMAGLAPLAESAGVAIALTVAPEAGRRPAGSLGVVLVNGLRNAIEACARAERHDRRVDATLVVDEGDDVLRLIIADTGPGPSRSAAEPPFGYGLGLSVCRRVVDGLGGRMVLEDAPEDRGAVLRVEVPLGAVKP